MLTDSDFKNLENSALIDLLAEQTKKFTSLLSVGILDQELHTYSHNINLLIREIKARWSKGSLYELPDFKISDLNFQGEGTQFAL